MSLLSFKTGMTLNSKRVNFKPVGRRVRNTIQILFVIDSLGFAGTEKQLLEIIKRLDPSRFEPYLCCLTSTELERNLNLDCQKIAFNIGSLRSIDAAKALYRTSHFIRKQGINIVQTFFIRARVFGALAGLLGGAKKVVFWQRDLGVGLNNSIKSLIPVKIANFFTDEFLANSNCVKKLMVMRYGIECNKVKVIYNGIDLGSFVSGHGNIRRQHKKKLGLNPNDLVVGVIANLREIKGINYFIQSAALVIRELRDVKFIIVGDGPLRQELELLSGHLGVRHHIIFTGSCSNVLPYLLTFDIGVLPSLSEGFSNAILEYMAVGIPVIATNVGGNKEQVINGQTGILVPPREPKAMADAIISILSDDKLRERMGKKGRALCEEKFSIGKMVSKLEAFYSSIA